MKNFTERQIWDVIRNLVSDNNSEIRKTYSGSVSAAVNAKYKNSNIPQIYINREKQGIISSGIKEIYQAIGERFVERDEAARDYYLDLLSRDRNWYDELSSDDLFTLYIFQNRIISKIDRETSLSAEKIISIVEGMPFGKYTTGHIDFSGKPVKTKEERGVEIDKKSAENIEGVLSLLTQRTYSRYIGYRHDMPERIPPEDVSKINYGKYSGRVAKAYLQNYQQEVEISQKEEDEELMDPNYTTETMVGVDIQGTPVFLVKYQNGEEEYRTSVGDLHKGPVFRVEEDDSFTMIDYIGAEEEVIPTAEPKETDHIEIDGQLSLFKREPELQVSTVQSEGPAQQ